VNVEDIQDVDTRQAAFPDLNDLVQLYYDDANELGRFLAVDGASMPDVYRKLLDHEHHMTVTVESHHGCPVDVAVLDYDTANDTYNRKIVLTRSDNGRVVQFGIVRLHVNFISRDVRAEIESREIPLGRVLINHGVLRRVELSQLWKVIPGVDLCRLFELAQPVETYGRTAIIYCDGEPAIELLEIVTPESED
jgi:chorismate-pyruvate lyase